MKSRHSRPVVFVLCLAAAVVLIVGLSAAQAFATDHTFVTIDYAGADGSSLSGISDAGQVVGEYWHADLYYHSFLRNTDGSTTPIEPAGAISTSVHDINNAGQVVGEYWDAFGQRWAAGANALATRLQ